MIKIKKKYIKYLCIVLIAIVVGAIVGFSYSYYEARNLNLRQFTFNHPDIPSAFDGKRLVIIADIHCNQYFTPSDVNKMVKKVNKLKPDIILLLGDNTNADTLYSNPFFVEIKKLEAIHGVYSVLGNHDYWEDIKIIEDGINRAEFKVCDNQSYWIHEGKDSIKIGGVGDLWEIEQLIDNTIYDVEEENFCILLAHNPDYIEELETTKVDLMLSGHTHGGQVTVFGLYAPIMPSKWKPHLPNTGQKYRYGWKDVDGTKLYVTTGVGMGKFPFRFFAAPEIVEITLKKNEAL